MKEIMSMIRSKLSTWAAAACAVWFPELAFNFGLKLIVGTLVDADKDDEMSLRADLMRSLVATSIVRAAR